ncbi:hypothetical protein ACFL1B_02235, partial [Nanoarchaeota archaeon]
DTVGYIVIDNRGKNARNGIEVEMRLKEEGDVVYSDFIGKYSVPEDEILVQEHVFRNLALNDGEYQVESVLFEKGSKKAVSSTTANLGSSGSKVSFAGLVLLLAIALSITGIFFAMKYMFRGEN